MLNWDRYTGDDDAVREAAGEVIRFVQFDLRNHIVRRLPLTFPSGWPAKVIGSDMPEALSQRHAGGVLPGVSLR